MLIFIINLFIISLVMKEKLKNSFILFITFLKIGLFTFGGGYAMLGLIQDEVVDKRHWISTDDFFEIVVIAESTPGPIAVNMATYIGYKVNKFFGAVFATIGLAIPSLIIIFVISIFYNEFLQFTVVQKAFSGIKVGVMVILITTVFKLAKQIKHNCYFYITFTLALATMICFSIFIPSFTWISMILIALGLILGVINTKISSLKGKNEEDEK